MAEIEILVWTVSIRNPIAESRLFASSLKAIKCLHYMEFAVIVAEIPPWKGGLTSVRPRGYIPL